MNTKYSNSDHYIDANSGVLKNKFGITDAELLGKQEADYAATRSYELAQNPLSGNFDLTHLKAIHRKLFGDLYVWAGEIRDIDISKGGNFFAHHTHIETAAHLLFKKLADEDYLSTLDAEEFSDRAAYYLGEINALHPFREGNGRVQREFINHLAYRNGWRIDWSHITQAEMIQGSIESFKYEDCSRFSAYIKANLHKL